MKLEDDPHYLLFLHSHYIIEKKQSFVPIWNGGRMVFPAKVVIKKKDLTILEKLKYYYKDFILFLRAKRRT